MFWRSIRLKTRNSSDNKMADDSRRRDLCKLFHKFKKEELFHELIEQGILEEGLLDTEGTKKAFVNRILKRCFAKVTSDHIGLMDLLCKFTQFHSISCSDLRI